jgi:hypothetical protein
MPSSQAPHSDLYEYPPSKTIIACCDDFRPRLGESNMVHIPENKHIEDAMLKRISDAAEEYPKPEDRKFEYGTAGVSFSSDFREFGLT